MMVAQGERMAKIVQGLLLFSRQRKPERAPVDLPAVIEQTIALRATRLRLSGIRLAANGATDVVGATINGNATLGDINKGLEVYSVGDITVSRVTADDNHGWGARLDNSTGEGTLIANLTEMLSAVCVRTRTGTSPSFE